MINVKLVDPKTYLFLIPRIYIKVCKGKYNLFNNIFRRF